jgi:hypothetical protein
MAVPVMVAPPAMAPVGPDVIAQAPHAAWHICSAMGEKYGPVPAETLRQWIAERRVLSDSLVWREGWTDWQRADTLFPELAAIPPAAMAPPVAIPVDAVPTAGEFPTPEAPAAFAPVARRPLRRAAGRRANNTHLFILIMLILSVLVLAPLLGYVLMR